jgi:hydrogenase expression/formation protein HypE
MNAEPPESAGAVSLAHGAGGRRMHRLIRETFLRRFRNPVLGRLEDSAELSGASRRIAFTTDSYVVRPLFFPGGDIGKLAVCGTVNDLAVKGARPRWLSAGFIISEGFPLEPLDRVCRSMACAARAAGVMIATGDTKVIPAATKPPGDEIAGELPHDSPKPPVSGAPRSTVGPAPLPELFINTAGIGTIAPGLRLGPEFVRPGDRILVNGSIGDHEAAIVVARGEFGFRTRLASDCAPLHGLIERLLRARLRVRMMRDPTRGGVATTLNEIADASGLGIIIDEAALPVRPEVQGLCEMLGLEPLYLANEGKVLVVLAGRDADPACRLLRRLALGRRASTIAEVTDKRAGVWLRTRLGSLRPLLMLEGAQLPRIC